MIGQSADFKLRYKEMTLRDWEKCVCYSGTPYSMEITCEASVSHFSVVGYNKTKTKVIRNRTPNI